MNTETQVSPDAETQNPAPEVIETPEVTTPEAEVEAQAEPEGDDPEKALKRMQRRIDKRTADVYRERARAEQLAQRLAELEAKGTGEQPEAKGQDVDSLVEERVSIKTFAEKANSIVETGSKKHADFVDTLKDLAAEVGEFVQRNGKPSPFMEVVLEVADDSPALLYYLGKNPDVASELADLSPLKLAKRLDRIERELGEASKPKTSNAPKPLEPVKAKSTDSGLSSDLPVDEWMKRREKELREKRGY
jgi:hypothetical protein